MFLENGVSNLGNQHEGKIGLWEGIEVVEGAEKACVSPKPTWQARTPCSATIGVITEPQAKNLLQTRLNGFCQGGPILNMRGRNPMCQVGAPTVAAAGILALGAAASRGRPGDPGTFRL